MVLEIVRKVENKLLLSATIANFGAMMLLGGGPLGVGPLSSAIFIVGLFNLSVAIALGAHRQLRRLPATMLVMCAFVILYPLIQLLPLPPAVWGMLPGRELEAQALALAGRGQHWHAITNAPLDTGFYLAMLVPLAAAYLSSLRMTDQENIILVLALLALVMLNALVGMIQVASAGTVLKFYASYHPRSLLGFFPNRNHVALLMAMGVLLLNCLCHVSNRQPVPPMVILLAGSTMLFGASLATGSRMGGALTVLAILLAVASQIPRRSGSRWLVIAGVAGALLLGATAVFTLSGVAGQTLARYERLTNDRRPVIWQVSQDVAKAYLPWGAGIGTFVNAYKKLEPVEALAPTYANHAHQDYLEMVIEGGIVAIAVVMAVLATWARYSFLLLRRGVVRPRGRRDRAVPLALTGAAMILLPLIHSTVDYPLRRMAIMGLFVLAFAWLGRPFMRIGQRDNVAAGSARGSVTHLA